MGIPATEHNKQLTQVAHIVERMSAAKLERTDLLVALGGGITGDLAGFAAAIYRRGIGFIQCPTTLLSMVDASVGGKTGANLVVEQSLKKNMVGAFHQPSAVLVDLAALDSLPDRELCAGLAECLKHGMIGSQVGEPELWEWTRTVVAAARLRDENVLKQLIGRNIRLKASVVVADERETAPDDVGGRALLNLGHTFGHVIETLPGVRAGSSVGLLHGEAVGLGLLAATAAAEVQFPTLGPDLSQVREAVSAAGLPTAISGIPDNAVLEELMLHDKKSAGGQLRVIFPLKGGRARVVSSPAVRAIGAGWDAIRAQESTR
jgi:3-dehydroquinate synthase